MNALLSLSLMHRQVARLLPWYVKGRLRTEEVRRVETHLAGCRACRTEAEGLTRLFDAHTAAAVDRPVDDAKLEALFDRIDRYEATHQREPVQTSVRGKEDDDSSARRSFLKLSDWFGPKPLLLAGTFAALVLAVIAVPTLQSTGPERIHRVLSTDQPVAALRIRVRFQSAPDMKSVTQLVGATQAKGTYQVERLGDKEYVVVFQKRPSMDVLSQLIESWRAAPNVAEVAIDNSQMDGRS
jgi:anti-sigma factor RsiW